MKANYAIVALNENNEILHLCFYEKTPSYYDIDSLKEELQEDQELGLVGLIPDKDYELLVINEFSWLKEAGYPSLEEIQEAFDRAENETEL